MIIDGAFNSDRLIEFLEALIKDAPRGVFLILDHVKGTATAASILFGVHGADPMVRRAPVRAWTLKPL